MFDMVMKVANTSSLFKCILTLCLVASSLSSGMLFAQQVTLITTDAERTAFENRSYLVVKSLTLKPGFTVNASTNGAWYAKMHPAAMPPTAPSTDQNFIRSESVLTSGVTTESQVKALGVPNKTVAFTYADGGGKTMQSTAVSASPGLRDIVQATYYDGLGRPTRSYLPYVATSGVAGSFRSTALTEQASFYSSPPSKVQGDSRPFSMTDFDNSPMNRVTKTKAPGSSWNYDDTWVEGTPSVPRNEFSTNSFKVNDASTIQRWVVVNGLPQSTEQYLAGELIINETSDEEGTTSRTYTNFLGQSILKEVQAPGGLWAKTYYVYNDQGNLIFIIPPAAASTLVPGQPFADRWFYQYEFDALQRQTGAKAPGAGWVYSIYDKWDRLVLSQDANQRAKPTPEWSFIKYDDLNRPVMTGILATATTRSALVNEFATVADNKRYETRDNSAVGYTLNQSSTTSTTIAESNLLTISYFDNYGFVGNAGWDAEGNSFAFVSEGGYTGTQFTSVLDLPTGSKVRNLGAGTWLNSVSYYDNRYRPLQTISENHFGKIDRETSEYDFSGKVLKTKRVHNNALPQTISVYQRFAYDAGGRLINTFHQVNSQPEVLLSSLTYNELGQLVDKKIHSADNGSSWLQSLDYRYNIRGWNTNLNYNANDGGDPTDYFGVEFGFENSLSGNTPRYDGSITTTRWKHDLSSKARVYNYTYDKGVFTGAAYKVDGTGNTQTGVFNETLTYDLNGNIQSLNRNSGLLTATTTDALSYNYGPSGSEGNQLMKVTDGYTATTAGFSDGNTSGDDYTYDANGNLVKDKNKGIKTPSDGNGIVYNFLDLPERINFSNGNYILINYDATGTKLSQTFYANGGIQQSRLDYSGEFIYGNGSPEVIFHSEGRLAAAANNNLITDVATREANTTAGYGTNGTVTVSTYTAGTPVQTYVKFVCNQSGGTPGVLPIGGYISVNAGETYTFKLLGYQSVGSNAALYVTSSAGNLVWPGALLKVGSANEDWVSASFTVPAGVTQIRLGVLWNSGVSGNTFYINRVALYKSDWEYQYFLNDHLGSPRVVLQTAPTTTTYSATMESGNYSNENERFLNLVPGKEVPLASANATPGGANAYVLNSSAHVGPGKSFKVLPGDVVNASVMAYYAAGGSYTKTSWANMATYVAGALSGGVAGAIDGVATNSYTTVNGSGSSFVLSNDQGSTRPSAFINYILFDETYTPIEAKSTPVGSTAGVLHQVLLPQVNVTQTGYLYVYLSYDNNTGQDVYFDEFIISYQESPVAQINSYYPFGMTALSWVRSGEYENKFLYQGKELVSETGWQDFGSRFYYNDLGRWFSTDPRSQFGSPYLAMGNNPVMGVDPDGEFWHIVAGALIGGAINVATHWRQISTSATPWRDGLAAFGIGAVAGGVGAATGGAAFAAYGGAALGAGGFIAGSMGGLAGSAATSPIQGLGNALYFGDPYSPQQFVTDSFMGGVTGGTFQGLGAVINGRNFWTGNLKLGPVPIYPSVTSSGAPDLSKTKLIDEPEIQTSRYVPSTKGDPQVGDDLANLPTTRPDNVRLTRGNFRDNLVELTGFNPKGFDAHHTLPFKFEAQFNRAGINIHDPRFGYWWKDSPHRSASKAINKEWANFFSTNPNPDANQIFKFNQYVLIKFGLH